MVQLGGWTPMTVLDWQVSGIQCMLSPSNSPLSLVVLALTSYKPITLISTASNPSQVCKLRSPLHPIHGWSFFFWALWGSTYWIHSSFTVDKRAQIYLFLFCMSRDLIMLHIIPPKHMVMCQAICFVAFVCAGIPPLSLLLFYLSQRTLGYWVECSPESNVRTFAEL